MLLLLPLLPLCMLLIPAVGHCMLVKLLLLLPLRPAVYRASVTDQAATPRRSRALTVNTA